MSPQTGKQTPRAGPVRSESEKGSVDDSVTLGGCHARQQGLSRMSNASQTWGGRLMMYDHEMRVGQGSFFDQDTVDRPISQALPPRRKGKF